MESLERLGVSGSHQPSLMLGSITKSYREIETRKKLNVNSGTNMKNSLEGLNNKFEMAEESMNLKIY